MGSTLRNKMRRLAPLMSIIVLILFVGCGGGDEPPPPYDPSEAEAEALAKFHDAASQVNSSLLSGNELTAGQGDQFMNALLLYLTSDGGNKSQPSIDYLIWYVKSQVKASIPHYQDLPAETQIAIMGQLGHFYQNQVLGSSNPALLQATMQADAQTGLSNLIPSATASLQQAQPPSSAGVNALFPLGN